MATENIRSQRRRATPEEARALASSIRLRILRVCLDEPMTNKEIAARLGANPATVLHHVRKLVATGFLEPQQERRGTRGAREVPYRSTGKSWILDVEDEPVQGGNRAMVDAFLEELSSIDIEMKGKAAPVAALARLGLRLPPEDLEELTRRLNEVLQEYAVREPDMERGIPYSLFVAVYRDMSREAPVMRAAG
jgi:predicted ArsR family transcriptional regulator